MTDSSLEFKYITFRSVLSNKRYVYSLEGIQNVDYLFTKVTYAMEPYSIVVGLVQEKQEDDILLPEGITWRDLWDTILGVKNV